jgi:hypothetical protein
MKSLGWHALALVALGLTAGAYLRPDMVLAAWGVLSLCFS